LSSRESECSELGILRRVETEDAEDGRSEQRDPSHQAEKNRPDIDFNRLPFFLSFSFFLYVAEGFGQKKKYRWLGMAYASTVKR
jgi:hypothetical protein